MNAYGCGRIPSELCHWITFLTKSLPLRSQSTFVELLIAAMLTTSGFVTDAYLIIQMKNHWGSYYKWLEKGKWSWLGLARCFTTMVVAWLPDNIVYLVVDDTLTLRSSKKAPNSQVHHQHGNKPNLATYVLGQCWVTLAVAVENNNGRITAIPLLNRLIPSISNTGKLVAAKTLVRATYSLMQGKTVRVLADSWYMRRVFIEAMLLRGFEVIGQVRIDTRLYDEPVKRKKQRGRPRKYGEVYSKKRVAHLKKTEVTLNLQGKKQKLRYRSKIVKARFINGCLVRAVWSEYYDEKKMQWRRARLLISTNTNLSAEQVIIAYNRRWSIESMYNQLKCAWGLKEAWQQTRQTLHRWVHITMIGYGLMVLLSMTHTKSVANLCNHSPWRAKGTQTAGHIRKGLTKIFRHVEVRQWWDKKRQIFKPEYG